MTDKPYKVSFKHQDPFQSPLEVKDYLTFITKAKQEAFELFGSQKFDIFCCESDNELKVTSKDIFN